MPSNFDTWRKEVDRLLVKYTNCTWADLCGDEPELVVVYEHGESAEDFVDRYISKNDLTTNAEIGLKGMDDE